MTNLYLLSIIWDIFHCSLLELLHIMWHPWRGYWNNCLFILLYLPNNQQPYGLFFYSYCISHWRGGFLQSYCCLCCLFLFFPKSMTLCGRNCHNCYILPWRTWHSCCYFSFIQYSTLEHSLMIYPFSVLFFCSVMSYIINISI